MKKLIAMCLLCLHLLSVNASLAVHAFAVYLSDRLFEKQASLGLYEKHDLTEVKLAVQMPGVTDWTSYENISGEVRFEDTAYNYVKIKVTHNGIYLLCVPNYSTTRLCNQNIIHAENMRGVPVNKKQHIPFEKGFSLSTFNFRSTSYRFFSPVLAVAATANKATADIVQHTITTPGQPPEFPHNIS